MMVSPESVYEELKTKSDEEVIKEIKRFKREISQLKKELELADDTFVEMCPSHVTQIYWIRQYIIEAKRLLQERGIEYTPTKAEQRTLEFDVHLSQLIEIYVERSGFFKGCNEYLVICGEQFQMVTFSKKFMVDNTPCSWMVELDKQSFVSKLEELHIGEWKSNYYACACDGEQWEIVFKFNDGTKRTFKGSNAYPYNFDDLMDLLKINNGVDDKNEEEDDETLPTEEEFAKLPEEEQQKIVEELFDSMTPEEQQSYLDYLPDMHKNKRD